MDGRFLLLVLGFAPCPVLPFAREKARQLVSVIVLGVTLATKVPVGPSFLFPQASCSYTLSQSINQSISLMSISSYASDLSAASHSHSCEITQSNPSFQSGMVQPVVNEMFATVHAAGSSLLGLFTSCTTFDSTNCCAQSALVKIVHGPFLPSSRMSGSVSVSTPSSSRRR
eukprot:scaffold13222_cov122-Isochrysis_galbana.AAC.5